MGYAQKLAQIIRSHPDFEVSAPTPFSLVCFRYRGSDDDNRAMLEKVNASGKAFLSHTVLNGRFVLRLAIGNIQTKWEDLAEVWELVKESAKETKEPTNDSREILPPL
jgi:aromatic-L-amino-acid decarboxylase